MSAKERFKMLMFAVSLLTIGHVGNFHPLLFENAEAHHQYTLTEILTGVYGYDYLGSGWDDICFSCSCDVEYDKWKEKLRDYRLTSDCVVAGGFTYCEPVSSEWIYGTERDGDTVYYYDWSTHEHHNCYYG